MTHDDELRTPTPATRRRFLLAAAAASALSAGARAQPAFPERPIRLIVPNPPGGPSDIAARLLAEDMRAALGQPLVVDNRPGATGMIGNAAAAAAPPDGYTVLVTSLSNHVIAPLVQKPAQFDPQADLAAVGLALRAVGLLVTGRAVPARSMRDFIAYAKARPGQLNYGSAGIGATNHIAIEQFKSLAGVDLVHVPYKGSGPMVTALMAGEVQFALLDFASAQPGLRNGSFVALAQTAARRHAALPDVPTLAEAGFRDWDPSFWIGLAVPKGTPGAVVARLNAALNAALAQTAVKARAQAYGWELVGGAPKVLADTVARDLSAYARTIGQLGIKGG